ncbi:MAG: GNAT family N-acetyltransferase [Bacteroidales bacterium]|nr:GNAT family N-acetyltransferase [Lachnoclostridium sp.]MCM1384881.1 GNAT family N-acetyltransferase [Lachnoclostridium sp.]MCM1465591.1 GNAT family N-acetyltransferase [Bacteroidales bacterium]
MTEKLKEEQPEACEYTFASNFLWRKSYEVEVAQICGCGLIRYRGEKNYRFSFPFGNGDKKAAIEMLLSYCREELGQDYLLDLCPLTEKQREELIEWFPGKFEIEADRDDFDYVYLREDLASLKGKKYHGKRNHIARFKDADDWSYEPLTRENIPECRAMSREWLGIKEDNVKNRFSAQEFPAQEIGAGEGVAQMQDMQKIDAETEARIEQSVEDENIALHEALDHYEEFGLVGGLLRKEGKVVAFTIGEPLNAETMVVHFEKAYPDLQGAYPMINQQFVLHECENYKYVNREEDVGDVGLRKAKLSYYPEILLKKYCAVESRVVFANETDFDRIKLIWKTCFEDEDKYIEFYLQNRFETENMLVIHEDGKPVSMASFLPIQLRQGEKWIPARYVYAVATLPQYRGRGFATAILQHGFDKYGEPLLLQPETEELQKFYEKLGFVDGFEEKAWEIVSNLTSSGIGAAKEIGMLNHGDVEAAEELAMPEELSAANEITPEEYKEIRDAHFDGDGYVCWDKDAIQYALSENEFCGGSVKKAGQDVILYRTKQDVLHVLETTLEGEALQEQIQKLLEETRSRKAVYVNKAGMIKYPQGMERYAGLEGKGYLNLTLG